MSESSCIDDNLKNSMNVQGVMLQHGNWHSSSCVPKIEDFVIRNLQLSRYSSRTAFGLLHAISEAQKNPKFAGFQWRKVEQKMFLPTQRSRIQE